MISIAHKSKDTQSPQYRIVVPIPLYGGSMPIAYHTAEAMRALGHDVHTLSFDSHYALYDSLGSAGDNTAKLKGRFAELLSDYTVECAIAQGANLVWYTAQSPITIFGLKRLREAGIRSALWFVEDVRRFDYWRHIAPHLDVIFTIQTGEAAAAIRDHGANSVIYLPCAANPRIHAPKSLSASDKIRYGAPVSFVGAGYPNRVRLFEQLNIGGLRLWGNDWPESWVTRLEEGGRRITAEESALIYNATDINLNIHSAVNGELLAHGDFVNPRTFEIAACGGFQIVNAQEPLSSLFANEELVVVNTVNDLRDAVKYYGTNAELRHNFASKAKERVLREHTYVHRMTTALNAIFSAGQPAFTWTGAQTAKPVGQYFIRDLIDASWGDDAMISFLNQFSPDEPATLDRLVAKLPKNPCELGRAEKMILLMKEFRQWGIEKGVIA